MVIYIMNIVKIVRILEEADGEKAVSIEFKILDGYDGEDNLYHVTNIHF